MAGTVVDIDKRNRSIMKHHLSVTEEILGFRKRASMRSQTHEAVCAFCDGLREKYPEAAAKIDKELKGE